MKRPKKSGGNRRWLASSFLLVVFLLSGCGGNVAENPPPDVNTEATEPTSPPVTLDPEQARQVLQAKLCEALTQTEQAFYALLSEESGKLHAYILGRKDRAKDFSNAMLSWSGQWAFLQSKLGVGGRKLEFPRITMDGIHYQSDPLEDYLQEQFESCVLKPSELEAELQHMLKRIEARLQVIETEMIMKLQADIGDLKAVSLPELQKLLDKDSFQAAYAFQLRSAYEQVKAVMPQDAVRSLVANDIGFFIATRLGASLATKLGISGVTSGLGLAGDLISGGASLALGFMGATLFDDLVKELLRSWFDYDPEADIAKQVEELLGMFSAQLFGQWECTIDLLHLQLLKSYLMADENYPLEQVRQVVDKAWEKLEKSPYLGLSHHLVQYMHAWMMSRQQALLSLIYGNEANEHSLTRWQPGKQPSLEEVIRRTDEMLKKWGNQ